MADIEFTGTFIVSDPCIGVTDRSCMEVCPVDCIYEVGNDPDNPQEPLMVVIEPIECISCGACVPECPVEAISIDHLVPEKWHPFITVNAMYEGRGNNDGPAPERREDSSDIAAEAMKIHKQLHEAG